MRKIKILFVYADINKADSAYVGNKGSYYYGIAQLSAVLKEKGMDTALLQYTHEPSKEEFLRAVEAHSPDIIGFSTTTMMVGFTYLWAGWLREAQVPQKLVIGGCHPSETPEDVMKTCLFDAIFVGEAEDSLVEYCQRLDENPTGILGTIALKEGKYVHNGVRFLEQDLDRYPFPDWEIFDYENLYDMKTHRRGIVTASRGCPYRCSFCSIEKYHDIYKDKGKFVRMKSVDYLIRECKAMLARYPDIEYFHFQDDVLVTRAEWVEEFSEKWPGEIGMDFYCNVNINSVKMKTITNLAKAGCRRIQIGVETGNEQRRTELLKKPVKDEKIIAVCNECRKYDVVVNSLNMIGLPYETEDHILETIKFNAKIKPGLLQCCIFYPFPNTSLYNYCVEHNLIKAFDPLKTSDYFSESVIKNPYLSIEALDFYRDYFKTLVRVYRYINIDWLIKLLPYKVVSKLIEPFKTKNELKKWLYKPKKRSVKKQDSVEDRELNVVEC